MFNSLIHDASTKQSKAILNLQSQCSLCLTGKQFQNHLSEIYTLLHFIRLDPWARDEVWQAYIKPNICHKSPKAIEMLQQLVSTVSLRGLNSGVLDLPKIEEQVGIKLVEPWRDNYLTKYEAFADLFGVNQAGGSWDSEEVLQQLMMLRLYCNHPGLVDASQFNLPNKRTTWKDSPKFVHLVTDLNKHLETEQDGQQAKAVIFASGRYSCKCNWCMMKKINLA